MKKENARMLCPMILSVVTACWCLACTGCIDIEAMNEETKQIGNQMREKLREEQQQLEAAQDEAKMPYFTEDSQQVTIHTTTGTYSVSIPSPPASGQFLSGELKTTVDSHEITIIYDEYGATSASIDGQPVNQKF